jgi:hypothetical protein
MRGRAVCGWPHGHTGIFEIFAPHKDYTRIFRIFILFRLELFLFTRALVHAHDVASRIIFCGARPIRHEIR